MGGNIVYIPKSKIQTVFNEKITHAYQARVQKLKSYLEIYDFLVPVEKDPYQDVYYLVGAYPRFHSLFHDNELVPCLVEEYTSPKEQLLKIARRFENQYTIPIVKREMVDRLKAIGITDNEIIRKTIFERSSLNKYQYSNDIPSPVQYLNEASGNPTSRETLNMIGRLTITHHWLNQDIIIELYKAALAKALSQQQIRSISQFLTNYSSLFMNLRLENQKKLLKYMINSPALLPKFWNKRLQELLQSQGISLKRLTLSRL